MTYGDSRTNGEEMIEHCDEMLASATPRQRKARLEMAYRILRLSLAIVSKTAASAIRNAEAYKRIIRQHEEWERLHDIPPLLPLLDDEQPAPTRH
jgi:hypothetical protein